MILKELFDFVILLFCCFLLVDLIKIRVVNFIGCLLIELIIVLVICFLMVGFFLLFLLLFYGG